LYAALAAVVPPPGAVTGVTETGLVTRTEHVSWRVTSGAEALENLIAVNLWPWAVAVGDGGARWVCGCTRRSSPCAATNWRCACAYCRLTAMTLPECATAPYHVPPVHEVVAVARYGSRRLLRAEALAREAGVGVEWCVEPYSVWSTLAWNPPGARHEWAVREALAREVGVVAHEALRRRGGESFWKVVVPELPRGA
jgi:hypothetical protein